MGIPFACHGSGNKDPDGVSGEALQLLRRAEYGTLLFSVRLVWTGLICFFVFERSMWG